MLCAVVSLLIPNEYAILRPGLAPFPYTEPPTSSLRAVASSPPASHPLPPGRRRCGPVARSLAGPRMRGWPLNRTGPSGLRDSCRTREDKAARSGVGPSDRLRRALRTGPEPRRSTHGNGYGAGGAGARPPPGGHRGTRSSAHLHGGRSIAHGCWGGVLRAGACGACGDGQYSAGQGNVSRCFSG